jgi:hypothetical protein
MKKLAIIFVLLTSLFTPNFASADSIPDEQFTFGRPPTSDPSVGIVVQDSDFLRGSATSWQALETDGEIVTATHQCHTQADVGCNGQFPNWYIATLPRCADGITFDCISALGVKNADGKALKVSYVEDFPGKREWDFPADPSINLPHGGSSFVVDIPEAPHAGGTKYLVVAQMTTQREAGEPKFGAPEFQAGIFAVSPQSGSYIPSHPMTDPKVFRNYHSHSFQRVIMDKSGGFLACAQATETLCLMPQKMDTSLSFSMSFIFSTKVTGWLHGRVSGIDAQISADTAGHQLVTVSGNPSIVPVVYGWEKKASLPPALAAYYAAHPNFYHEGTGFGGGMNPNEWTSVMRDSIFYDQRSMDETVLWLTAIKDTAPVAPVEWSIRSMDNGNGNPCFVDSTALNGIVTTNATQFLSGPPTFNQSEGTLDYKVAAPHFLPNGDVFKGSYNLVMKSSVARCLYNFTSAPIQATVSVLGADGSTQVATTVVGEKNGWLYLSANGFTFSNPTLKVRLFQNDVKVAESTPTAKSPIAAKQITCIKGKVLKKVTTATCPKGWNKK